MTRVDFYVLGDTRGDGQEAFACRIAEKAHRQGLRVYVYADSEPAARDLDQLLWTFRQDSFVPHQVLGDKGLGPVSVCIGYGDQAWTEADVLVNLDAGVPVFFSQYSRVIEIVPAQDGAAREAARAHFRYYRDRGYPLSTHDI